ncbi:hypothetical protein PVK62_03010 [Aliivibrio sp. S3MY1]|nr:MULTISPECIES: hypothetical protein [unclassified Aliivibrio]MDD9194804.1 hypothetical protein [Aliivibrio sp. S3MY1]MDD9198655.1 hypothetical protein [Aliivibrio sp. S2MY1]
MVDVVQPPAKWLSGLQYEWIFLEDIAGVCIGSAEHLVMNNDS